MSKPRVATRPKIKILNKGREKKHPKRRCIGRCRQWFQPESAFNFKCKRCERSENLARRDRRKPRRESSMPPHVVAAMGSGSGRDAILDRPAGI